MNLSQPPLRLYEEANTLMTQGHRDEAGLKYEAALRLEPNHYEANIRLALTLIGSERFEDALRSILKATQHDRARAALEVFALGKDLRQMAPSSPLPWGLWSTAHTRGLIASPWQRPPALYDPSVVSRPWWSSPSSPLPSWLASLELHAAELQAEFLSLYRPRHTPLEAHSDPLEGGWGLAGTRQGNQYDGGLVQGAYWRELVFWDRGRPQPAALSQAPLLTRLLGGVSEATSCWVGQVHYSVLGPGTRLRPHCGATNLRLTAHLTLVLPRGAGGEAATTRLGIRVANETRTWVAGKVLVFDDSYEHEVWNLTEEDRAVLLINFWHPSLGRERREELTRQMEAGTLPIGGRREEEEEHHSLRLREEEEEEEEEGAGEEEGEGEEDL